MITSRSLGLSATHTTSLFGVGRPRSGAGPRLNCAELTGNSVSLSQSIAVYILLLINFKYVAGRLCPHGYAEAGWPQLRAHPPREGLTQEAVEERSGFSQQYLSGLERGRRNPTIVTLYELAHALNVSYLDLLKP